MQIRSKANQTRDNEILLNLNVQACHVILRFRGNTSSSPVLCKKGVFKNLAKLPGKLLPWSIFLIKLQVFSEGLFQVFRKIITRSCSIKTWCYVIRHKEIKKCKKGLGRLKLLEVFASDKLELHNFQIYLHEKASSVYYVRKIFSKNVHVRIRG